MKKEVVVIKKNPYYTQQIDGSLSKVTRILFLLAVEKRQSLRELRKLPVTDEGLTTAYNQIINISMDKLKKMNLEGLVDLLNYGVDKYEIKNSRENIEAAAIAMYKQWYTLKKICETLNISEARLLRIVRKNKVPMRNGYRIANTRKQKVVDLYVSDGNTIKGIMTETGVKSEQTIYRILDAAGIERKGRKTNKN